MVLYKWSYERVFERSLFPPFLSFLSPLLSVVKVAESGVIISCSLSPVSVRAEGA